MNIAICDDSELDRFVLERLLKETLGRYNLSTFDNAQKLMASFETHTFDVLFLDVYMPGLNGVEAARRIKEISPDSAVVFTTSSPDHALEGFDLGVVHYLLKPLDSRKVADALKRCHRKAPMGMLSVKSGRDTIPLNLSDIDYIESVNKDCIVFSGGQQQLLHTRLRELELLLPEDAFMRCHRSYIVNLNKVTCVRGYDFVLRCGVLVPIKRQERLQMKQAFEDFCFKQLRS